MPWQLRYRTLPFLLAVAARLAAGGRRCSTVVVAAHADAAPRPHVHATAHGPDRASAPRTRPAPPGVSKIVLRFVKTAVMREHASRQTLLEAWQLTGPKLKQGTTLHEWLAGTSSVMPFPDGAVAPGLHVDHSYANDALLELALYPKVTGQRAAGRLPDRPAPLRHGATRGSSTTGRRTGRRPPLPPTG